MLFLKCSHHSLLSRSGVSIPARLFFSGLLSSAGYYADMQMGFNEHHPEVLPFFMPGELNLKEVWNELLTHGFITANDGFPRCFRISNPEKLFVEIKHPRFTGNGPSGYGRGRVLADLSYRIAVDEFCGQPNDDDPEYRA